MLFELDCERTATFQNDNRISHGILHHTFYLFWCLILLLPTASLVALCRLHDLISCLHFPLFYFDKMPILYAVFIHCISAVAVSVLLLVVLRNNQQLTENILCVFLYSSRRLHAACHLPHTLFVVVLLCFKHEKVPYLC